MSVISERTRTRSLRYGLYGLVGATVVFLWLPLFVMIFLSFATNSTTVFPFEGLTLDHYAATFQDDQLMGSLTNSFKIATTTAMFVSVIGVLASFGLARFDFPGRGLFRTLVIVPLLIPGVILGISLLIYFQQLLQFTIGFATVVIAHSIYGLPFVVLPVTARLYGFDESLEEAARDLGADPITTFREITFPVIAPAVLAGALFVWIRSFEDFIRAYFTKGVMDVLTTTMFSMIKHGVAPKLNAVSTFIIFLVAVVLFVATTIGSASEFVGSGVDDE
jgi:ABC-type spermidine/putrescine transport system permease subunit II